MTNKKRYVPKWWAKKLTNKSVITDFDVEELEKKLTAEQDEERANREVDLVYELTGLEPAKFVRRGLIRNRAEARMAIAFHHGLIKVDDVYVASEDKPVNSPIEGE